MYAAHVDNTLIILYHYKIMFTCIISYGKWCNFDVVDKRVASRPQLNNVIFYGMGYRYSKMEYACHMHILFLKNAVRTYIFYLSVGTCVRSSSARGSDVGNTI